MTATTQEPGPQAADAPPEMPYADHLPRAVPEAWQVCGPVAAKLTRTAGRFGVGVEVHCLPPAGLPGAAEADARRALDVSATVATDERVTEATAMRDRLAAALERDRQAVKDARREADGHAAAAREALVNGGDPDPAEKKRDAATTRGDRLASRVGELSELLAAAEQDLESATSAAERDARLAVKEEYQRRLATVSARLSAALSAELAELWTVQGVTNALAAVR